MGAEEIRDAVVNGAGELSYIPGLHQVPNPFPDDPFPRIRLAPTPSFDRGFLGHELPGGGVQAQALRLVGRLVESGVAAASGRRGELP